MQYGFILLIILCLLFSSNTSSYACVGARPMGMGGAFTAVADDINAVYWNPAGLQQLKGSEFTYTFEGDREENGDYKSVYPHFAAIGFKTHGYALGLAYIEVSNWAEDMWRGKYMVFGVYSASVNEYLSIGFNLGYREVENPSFKFFRYPTKENLSSVPMVFDPGILYKYNDTINIGLLMQGLGNVRPAIAIKPSKSLTIALDFYDVLNVTEGGNKYQIGIEHQMTENMTLRAGSYGSDEFTLGFGYSSINFNFDSYLLISPRFEEYYRSIGFTIKF